MEQRNRRMLRARDRMDRTFAEPLDIPALASVAGCSEAHFIRTFGAVFGETPHRYLQRRRVERAMHLLREGRSVTDVCFAKGASGFTAGFTTSNCQKVYENLKAKGVDITHEPVTHFYGTDIGIRDPFGNHLRIVQLADPPRQG